MILSVTVYKYKKKQTRYYLLSKQLYPELIISINIKKHQGKIAAILVNSEAVKDLIITDLRIELISKKREFNYYSLQELAQINNFPLSIKKEGKAEFIVPFEDFRTMLMDGEHPFSTYRFVVVSNAGQSFKSHEMGFNKKWVIYRPDTGSYN